MGMSYQEDVATIRADCATIHADFVAIHADFVTVRRHLRTIRWMMIGHLITSLAILAMLP